MSCVTEKNIRVCLCLVNTLYSSSTLVTHHLLSLIFLPFLQLVSPLPFPISEGMFKPVHTLVPI